MIVFLKKVRTLIITLSGYNMGYIKVLYIKLKEMLSPTTQL